MSYGKELIIDLHFANILKFNREDLGQFLDELCLGVLQVRPQERHFWDDEGVPKEERQTDPKTVGTTVVQFLLFSNVTIHALTLLGKVYINIFVCRDFDINAAIVYCSQFFNATVANIQVVERK